MIPIDRLFLYRARLLATGAALLVSTAAGAQDFAACTKIADDQQRLACFDRASRSLSVTPAPERPAAVPVTPAVATPPVSRFNPFSSFGLGESAPTKPEDFGRSSLPVTAAPAPRPDEPQPVRSITATAIRIIDPEGKPTFVLDNNQVWVSVKYIHIVPRSKGPNTVNIESSAIGYLMTLNDASFQFGVRRVK
jgi:hypothetical protein